MPTSGNNKESIFPASEWNYTNRVNFCKYVFDAQPRPNWITTHFVGHNIERALKRFGSNIIFFNGLRDPWSGGGVLKNVSKTYNCHCCRRRLVNLVGAHHVDLRFSTSKDPKWLQDVRKTEANIIANWISQYYHDLAHL
ncbi:hypothetical protein Patl1_32647 [Pistacia atlantica]|uniref:Uncharacterized protein n=1 Tax=Pistacia atlantica TaxID=434234 RepID=A0ACC1AQN1_9ROSI|nr:hypothetical protein Patl1_32647 [Pistacia atlantica]